MRLVLDAPAGWRIDSSGTWTLLTSPDNQVRVEISPLFAPGQLDPRGVFERGVAPPASVEYVQLLEDVTTRDGWPLKLATLRVVEGTAEREWRIGGAYTMVAWVGAVVARVKTRASYDAHRVTLLDLLGSARPHLRGDEPVCLAELYLGEPP